MIGHYLLTLTPAQEQRVLTQRFEPRYDEIRAKIGLPVKVPDACGCLVLCATAGESAFASGGRDIYHSPGVLYENLCGRFGMGRVNAAIRARILANQARRALAPRCEVVSEVA